MNRPSEIENVYLARLAERQQALAAKERTHAGYAWARIAVFLSAIAIFVIAGPSDAGWLLAPLAAFVVLAVAHARVLNARDRARSAVAFYERGLARVRHEWIGRGRQGENLAPRAHLYAADLDLFGRGSLFELLATTRTHAGEETLARWMLAPAGPDEVRRRQEAVRELAGRLDLREQVAVLGDEVRLGVHAELLREWSSRPIALAGTAARFALVLSAAATIFSLVWYWQTDTGGLFVAALIIVQSAATALYKARVTEVVEAVDEPAHDLDLLAGLLATLERESFAAVKLKDLQRSIAAGDRPASVEIARLSRLVAMLSSRNNVIFAIPAALLMWATQWAFAIEAWRRRAGVRIPDWLDAVGEFEALLALAAFSAEHSSYAFPSFAAAAAHLQAEELAHPVMDETAVPNTVRIGAGPGFTGETAPDPNLLIVSGSNMSGKSTLLRAIGVNVVLAGMGAPVRARSMTLSPLALGASIRVTDSLTEGTSRFMAEVTRLKAIVDLAGAERGAVLFLLDEILGGTNSHDRRVGAEAVLMGLLETGAIGLVTTHDLALGEIANRLPDVAANVHFEDQFDAERGGGLVFDFRLKPGIVQTSNALRLMRSIGLGVQ